MKNWNQNKSLKWALVFVFLFFALFTFLKDRGYCEEVECEYMEPGKEFNYEFPDPPIPIEDEYLFQYPTVTSLAKSINLQSYECRSNWQAKPGRSAPPSASQRQKWQDEYDMHHFNGVRTYNDAYNRIWFLPNLTLRQLGRDAWVSACAMAGTKTPGQALVMAFATMLSQYGLHCLDEWDYIADKLYWSEYHFGQCAHYASLLHS